MIGMGLGLRARRPVSTLPVAPGARAPATQPPAGPAPPGAPRPRPPVVPAQTTSNASSVAKPVSPQTRRTPEQVSALLEAMQTRVQRFDHACRLLVRNRVQEARAALTQLVSEDPHNRKYKVKLMHATALEYRDEGRIDEAVRELERAVNFDPEAVEIRTALEKLREQRGKGLFSKLFGR